MDTIAETNALGIICEECGEIGKFQFIPLKAPNGMYVGIMQCKTCRNAVEF